MSASQSETLDAAAVVAQRRAQTALGSLQLLLDGARPDRIRSAEAAVRQARAQVVSLQASAGDLVLLAPSGGVVTGRHVEPGEVIGAGVPLISLGDPSNLWVRVYVAPSVLATVRLGTAADVRVEGVTERTFERGY